MINTIFACDIFMYYCHYKYLNYCKASLPHPQALGCQKLRCWSTAGSTRALCHLGGRDKTLWCELAEGVRASSLVNDAQGEAIQSLGCCLTSGRASQATSHKPWTATAYEQGSKLPRWRPKWIFQHWPHHHKPFQGELLFVGWREQCCSWCLRPSQSLPETWKKSKS